jgi:AraC-like DNA-binding protein
MARRFLHIDAAEAVDRVIPLADVLGRHARELHERLEETDSSSKCCAILVETLSRPSEAPGPVELAIEAMTRAHGDIELGWIADQAGMSERQFRRRCLAESGLAPKHLARVLRFRRACRLATQGASWLTIAAESGYFDQAHLIRDFREFTGATPVSVFSKTSPAAVG